MRSVGGFALFVLLAACTNTPLFPPDVMNGVNFDTVGIKAWKDQVSHPSANFASQKVEMEGTIIKVIPKPEGAVILIDGHPIGEDRLFHPEGKAGEDILRFAIVFNGMVDPDMLQTGNRVVVIGVTDKPALESIGWMPRPLPHLRAQCLHIWKTDESERNRFPYGDMSRATQEEQTFCHKENIEKHVSTGG
ncbi:MAG TPA: Slp family lipoprotein [Nitrospira sp.]|nr:Slp family lipoprotein [Nitrospira sp.]